MTTSDARARLHAMFNLPEADEAELNARIDAVIAEEAGPIASRLAAVEQVVEDARDKNTHAVDTCLLLDSLGLDAS